MGAEYTSEQRSNALQEANRVNRIANELMGDQTADVRASGGFDIILRRVGGQLRISTHIDRPDARITETFSFSKGRVLVKRLEIGSDEGELTIGDADLSQLNFLGKQLASSNRVSDARARYLLIYNAA